MLRQLTALLVAGAIVFGNLGAGASPSTVANNEPPLKPGGPADIRQAQGLENVDVWIFSGLILGAIIWVLVGNDNDDSTNGTDAE